MTADTGGSATVAVRTPDFAFCDLSKHQIPRDRDMYQATHIGPLIAQVVEVQNIRV